MDIPEIWSREFNQLIIVIAVWLITLAFVRFFHNLIALTDRKCESFHIEERTLKAIDRMLDTCAVILAFGITLNIFGMSGVLYTTLTAFGVIGIIIGLAIKDLTSNIFAGVMMIFNPSFMVGDFIEVGNYSGTVRTITLRMTMLVRSDGVLVNLPNTMFITMPVINYSATGERRVEISVGVAHECDIGKAIEVVQNSALEHTHTIREKGVDVALSDVKDSAVYITVRFWVPRAQQRSSTSEVLREITGSFSRYNIQLAVPRREYIGSPGITGPPVPPPPPQSPHR